MGRGLPGVEGGLTPMVKAMKWLIVLIRALGIQAHAWVREARCSLAPATTTSLVRQDGPTLPPPESFA